MLCCVFSVAHWLESKANQQGVCASGSNCGFYVDCMLVLTVTLLMPRCWKAFLQWWESWRRRKFESTEGSCCPV
jgi:hypothetical protein